MIPVHQPEIGEEEISFVLDALKVGEISGSFGHYITDFEQKFAEYCDCKYGVAVSSGSTALHLAAVLSGIGPGDAVLMNACTNIASANAIVMQGGVIVPVDSEEDTWNMDTTLLQKVITRNTKAIMPVHIYGHPVDMIKVMWFAKNFNLFVIEDCAEAHGSMAYDRKVGSFGDVGCFSFYANKVITTGEGGMLVTNRKDLAERAKSLRNLAFTKPRFKHNEVGYNYRLTNLQAAIGLAQLSRIESILDRKRQIAKWYTDRLSQIKGLRLPVEKYYAKNIYWMYGIVIEPKFGISRNELSKQLQDKGIETRDMFCPMNLQPSLLKINAVIDTPCPVAENLWNNGLYLPSGNQLTPEQVNVICDTILELKCVSIS
jgi:perosamine synthetase